MLESFPFILLIGTALGFLSGVGVGGGSLLILWLTMVLGMDPLTARAINLLFFIPSALIACMFRWKQGCLKPKTVLPAVAAGCVCAGVFSLIGMGLDTTFLRKGFGILLILTGLRELFYHKNSLQAK